MVRPSGLQGKGGRRRQRRGRLAPREAFLFLLEYIFSVPFFFCKYSIRFILFYQ
jgi:hypothetical protein